MNQKPALTPAQFLKSINVVFYGIFASMCFVVIFFYFETGDASFTINFDDINFIISCLLGISVIVLSRAVFNLLINKIETKLNLLEKTAKYQTAYIVQIVILEAIVFLIIFVLATNKSYFIVPFIILLYFFSLKPNEEKIKEQLNLTVEQKNQFSKQDSIIS